MERREPRDLEVRHRSGSYVRNGGLRQSKRREHNDEGYLDNEADIRQVV